MIFISAKSVVPSWSVLHEFVATVSTKADNQMLTMLQNNTLLLVINECQHDQYITSDDCGVFAIIVLTVSCNFVLCNLMSLPMHVVQVRVCINTPPCLYISVVNEVEVRCDYVKCWSLA